MSSALPPAYGLKDQTERYVAAVRAGRRGADRIVTTGGLHCISCGASMPSKTDFARYAGVSVRDLTKWLNRQPLRDDVAKRIRDKLFSTDE